MSTIEELNTENAALRVDVSYWNDRFNFEARLKDDLKQDKANLYERLEAAESNVDMWQKRALDAEKKVIMLEEKLNITLVAIDTGVAALDAMKKVNAVDEQRRAVVEEMGALEADLWLKDAIAAEKAECAKAANALLEKWNAQDKALGMPPGGEEWKLKQAAWQARKKD